MNLMQYDDIGLVGGTSLLPPDDDDPGFIIDSPRRTILFFTLIVCCLSRGIGRESWKSADKTIRASDALCRRCVWSEWLATDTVLSLGRLSIPAQALVGRVGTRRQLCGSRGVGCWRWRACRFASLAVCRSSRPSCRLDVIVLLVCRSLVTRHCERSQKLSQRQWIRSL